MADETPSDEQRLYQAFQQVADVLLPLENDLRKRVYVTLGTFFGYEASHGGLAEASGSRPAGERSPPPIQIAPREPPSPKDFLFQKQPNTDLERVACLAYYLMQYRDTNHFKTIDISKLNTEAAQRKFANAAASVDNARRGGFLTPVGGGMKQLTAEGERFVDALPDQAAAKAALSKKKVRRQRRRGPTGKATASTQGQAE